MGLTAVAGAHSALGPLNHPSRFRFFELEDERGLYAAAAVAEHPDCLELHLAVLRFGPGVVRALRADLEELRALAKSLGKSRIAALRTEDGPVPDGRWPRFTRLFGFTGQRVYQAAELVLE